MTNNKLSITFLILIFFGLIISSCEKEFVVENYDPATNTGGGGTIGGGDTTGGGTTGGVDTTRDCKACAYIPICNGSTFTYSDTTNGIATVATENYQIVKDTLIGSMTFQKLTDGKFWNCTNGESTLIVYSPVNIDGTTTVDEARMIMLKANEPVNTTWTSVANESNGMSYDYVSKIVSKGAARTVAGRNYPDVIHVNIIGYITFNGTRDENTITDYFYARGVGVIEVLIHEPTLGTLVYHRTLQSYMIP